MSGSEQDSTTGRDAETEPENNSESELQTTDQGSEGANDDDRNAATDDEESGDLQQEPEDKQDELETEMTDGPTTGDVPNSAVRCRGELQLPVVPPVDLRGLASQVVKGHVQTTFPGLDDVVRIYVHSTGKDTSTERHALETRVSPKLRQYCRARGHDCEIVDVNWRDDPAEDDLTRPAADWCLRELQTCQQTSSGPNFITFLSEKSPAPRHLPASISAADMHAIVSALDEDEDKALLLTWYQAAENAETPEYRLNPELVTETTEASDTEKAEASDTEKAEESDTEKAEESDTEKAEESDTEKAEESDTAEDLASGKASPAEQSSQSDVLKLLMTGASVAGIKGFGFAEIQHGVLSTPRPEAHCYWFKRTLDGISDHLEDEMVPLYTDVDDLVLDESTRQQLDMLKSAMSETLSPSNMTEYHVTWTPKGVTCAVPDHKDYVEVLCEDMEVILTTMVDQGLAQKRAAKDISVVALEANTHLRYTHRLEEDYLAREDLLDQVKSRLLDGNTRAPLLLHGNTGSGKSTLLGKLASELPGCLGADGAAVISRHLGISSSLASTQSLLRSLCAQIRRIAEEESTGEEVPQDLAELCPYFLSLLVDLPCPMVILLDDVEVIEDLGDHIGAWLPSQLLDNLVVILTTSDVDPQCKSHLSDDCIMELAYCEEDDIEAMVAGWCKMAHNVAVGSLPEQLQSISSHVMTPLHLRLVFDVLRHQDSKQQVDQSRLGTTASEALHALFDLLEVRHGSCLVSRALGYITVTQGGLSPSELVEVLSLEDAVLDEVLGESDSTMDVRQVPFAVLARLLDDLRPYVEVLDFGVSRYLAWRHWWLEQAAWHRYTTEIEEPLELHRKLCEYFTGKKYTERVEESVEQTEEETGLTNQDAGLIPAQPYVFGYVIGDTPAFNWHKIKALSHHGIESQDVAFFKNVVLDFHWLYFKLMAQSLDCVFEEFVRCKENSMTDPDIDLLIACLEKTRDSLSEDYRLLPACLLRHLGAIESDNTYIQKWLYDAARPDCDCLYSSYVPSAVDTDDEPSTSEGKPAEPRERLKYAGHTGNIVAVDLSTDGSQLISVSEDNTFRLWDVATAQELKSVPIPEEDVACSDVRAARFCNDDQWAVLCCFTSVQLPFLDIERGGFVRILHLDAPATVMDVLHKLNLLFAMEPHGITVWEVQGVAPKVKTIRVNKAQPLSDDMAEKVEDYLKVMGTNVLFHKGGSNVVKMVRYGTGQKTDTYALYGKKEARNRVCKFAALPGSGYLVCFHYPPADGVTGQATLDIVDVEKCARVHCFLRLQLDLSLGLFALVAPGDNYASLLHAVDDSVQCITCDVTAKSLEDSIDLDIAYPDHMVSSGKGGFIISKSETLEQIRVVDLGEEAEADSTDVDQGRQEDEGSTLDENPEDVTEDSVADEDQDTLEEGERTDEEQEGEKGSVLNEEQYTEEEEEKEQIESVDDLEGDDEKAEDDNENSEEYGDDSETFTRESTGLDKTADVAGGIGPDNLKTRRVITKSGVLEEPVVTSIVGMLPGSPRYVLCRAAEGQLTVWDLYERRTARIVTTEFPTSCVTSLSSHLVAGLDDDEQLRVLDLVTGAVVRQVDRVLPRQLARGASGELLFVSPKGDCLIAQDAQTGEEFWRMSCEDDEVKLTSLFVCSSSRVALCQGVDGDGASSTYAFDLENQEQLSSFPLSDADYATVCTDGDVTACVTSDGACGLAAVPGADGENEVVIFQTADGNRRILELEEAPSLPGRIAYTEALDSYLIAPTEGCPLLVHREDLSVTPLTWDCPSPVVLRTVSHDGKYACVTEANRCHVTFVLDLVKGCRFATYVATDDVLQALFTEDNHFLLLAVKGQPWLEQLCMHEVARTRPESKLDTATMAQEGGDREMPSEYDGKCGDSGTEEEERPGATDQDEAQETEQQEEEEQEDEEEGDDDEQGDETGDGSSEVDQDKASDTGPQGTDIQSEGSKQEAEVDDQPDTTTPEASSPKDGVAAETADAGGDGRTLDEGIPEHLSLEQYYLELLGRETDLYGTPTTCVIEV